jgi:hypothetical protein
MRHTFYQDTFVTMECALARAKELVNEMTGDPNPDFGIEEGDAGWCIYHKSHLTAFTGMELEMRVVVYFTELHGVIVEGFIHKD